MNIDTFVLNALFTSKVVYLNGFVSNYMRSNAQNSADAHTEVHRCERTSYAFTYYIPLRAIHELIIVCSNREKEFRLKPLLHVL